MYAQPASLHTLVCSGVLRFLLLIQLQDSMACCRVRGSAVHASHSHSTGSPGRGFAFHADPDCTFVRWVDRLRNWRAKCDMSSSELSSGVVPMFVPGASMEFTGHTPPASQHPLPPQRSQLPALHSCLIFTSAHSLRWRIRSGRQQLRLMSLQSASPA
jgi:hypothetical protein